MGEVCDLFRQDFSDPEEVEHAENFLKAFEKYRIENGGEYIQVIQGMPKTLSQDGTRWLQSIVDALCIRAGTLLSTFGLF